MSKPLAARTVFPRPPAKKGLKLLILGGTGFLGPAIVEAALARGHSIDLFHRGKSNPDMFPDLEHIIGDRDPNNEPGLKALEGRKWDAVLDTSSYVPRITGASAELLKDAVDHYLLISTISVYPDLSIKNMDETAATGTMEDPTNEEVRRHYGPLKALCEQKLEEVMPGRATVLRPGLIVGPLDQTDRFTYWPLRVRSGGEVLVPGEYNDPMQWIDARDLAEFAIHCVEEKTMGIFNCCGPEHKADMAELVYGCKAVSGGDAQFTWVNAEFCAEQGLGPWAQLPVWAPGAGPYAGLNTVDCSKGVAAGMRTRPLADTVRDTFDWWDSLPDARRATLRAGMSREVESKALEAWHNR